MSEGRKRRESSYAVEWVDSTLNKPIPEKIFSMEGLGLVPGDRVMDNVAGVNYVYKEELLRLFDRSEL